MPAGGIEQAETGLMPTYASPVHTYQARDDTVAISLINIQRSLLPIVGIVVSRSTSSGKSGGGLVASACKVYGQ